MCDILIFGGTTEGRKLAEFCDREKIHVIVSVVSEYGKEILAESPYIEVNVSPMDEREMERFILRRSIGLVVDATHPYALLVTENIRKACEAVGVKRLRCGREFSKADDGMPENHDSGPRQEPHAKAGNIVYVSDAGAAAEYLKHKEGKVLLTTGSKELSAFAILERFKERCFARVLPSPEVFRSCEKTGLPMSHLIGMQGPFSRAMNTALLHLTQATYLVTKEAGAAGGFEEKLQAAWDCNVTPVVIRRREENDGISVEQVCRIIKDFPHGNAGSEQVREGFQVILAGAGPGGAGQVTEAVARAVRASEVLIGSPRVLDTARELLSEREWGSSTASSESVPVLSGKGIRFVEKYMPEEVVGELELCRLAGAKRVVVLFSGDTGFYSGTKKLIECLREKKMAFTVLPGISSVAYMASRLGISWEDAALFTAHGRDFDPVPALERGQKRLFLLLSGENGAGKLCGSLCDRGYGHYEISVGENLSYPQERILTGRAEELREKVFGSLCLMLIEKR